MLAEVDYDFNGETFPFGAHLAVVDVDTETGKAVLRRMVAVDDAGRILNPLLADGQVHGGLAQGIAQALLEEFRYDEDGNPLTTNLADYTFISAAELPSFECVRMETPTPRNELGAKGIGESGTIGSTPAVHNAVIDAVAHLGVRHIDMPTTPETGMAGDQGGVSVRARMTVTRMTVNGVPYEDEVEPRLLLAQYIRDTLGLTGTNIGCDTTSCGACTVLLDGESVKSCTVLAVQAEGAEITTIEGMALPDGRLHPIQQAFRENHGLQCGFCTPGHGYGGGLTARRSTPADGQRSQGGP